MAKNTIKNKCVVIILFFLSTSLSFGQKKVLDHTVYDAWKSLSDISISEDGKYAVTIVKEQEGDDFLLVRNLSTMGELIIPRAYFFKITPDQKKIVAQIKTAYAVTREEKIKKTTKEKMSKDSLAIIDLKNFSVSKIPNVNNFAIGKDFSKYIAYSLDDTLKIKKNDVKSYTLIVRDLDTAKEDTIKNITEYVFSRNGKRMALAVKPSPKDSLLKNEVVYINLESYNKRTISKGKTIYKSLVLSESGDRLAFLASTDSLKKDIKEYGLYYFSQSLDSADLVANRSVKGMPLNWEVSEKYKPKFSKNETRLLLGTAPIVLPKDTTIPDFEKAQLDIWHWKEPLIQPQQLVELKSKREQTYLAYLDLKDGNTFYQLERENMPNVQISDEDNGRFALGLSNLPYEFETQWDIAARLTNDVWVLDLDNKTNKQIKQKLASNIRLSPLGDYIVWYDLNDRQYYSYSTKTGKEQCLTNKIEVNFWDEKYDMPSIPDFYGFATWTEKDKSVLVYDAYDIWELNLELGDAKNITENIGRENKITFRYIKTDPESRFIKKDESLLLSAFNNIDKQRGFYGLQKSKMRKYIMDRYTFSTPIKAKNKGTYLFTQSNFNTSPNLFVTQNDWKTEINLSDINPQMKEYNWGTAELVAWTTFDGKLSEGIVYKPENFDPSKKYPLMVYFYEKHSDGLYNYFPPAPSRSIINIPFYVSRGYIVFTPDIQYTTGHPGESAYNSVVSGVEDLCKNSWIDKDNMAIQGQSWGGYQVAYLVTRTNMFKAAGAGAPVSNMFSAYGGIRWETGKSRQYQYEQTQSRIGTTMWDAPELYKENSPVFFANKVETPLLIMHNDNDGAVPWYQGIEYFMALRRLDKPVWLLQYNNEGHNLKERRNTKDLSIRLQQFFDHYLKGEPMPVWMKTGIPAIEKGKTYGFELVQ